MEIVVVHWLDAMYRNYEMSGYDARQMKGLEMMSAGFLIRNDDEVITLSMETSDPENERQYRHTTVIPKSYVTKIEIKDFDA